MVGVVGSSPIAPTNSLVFPCKAAATAIKSGLEKGVDRFACKGEPHNVYDNAH